MANLETIKASIEQSELSLEELRSLRNVIHYAICKAMTSEYADMHEEAAYYGSSLSTILTDIKESYHNVWECESDSERESALYNAEYALEDVIETIDNVVNIFEENEDAVTALAEM